VLSPLTSPAVHIPYNITCRRSEGSSKIITLVCKLGRKVEQREYDYESECVIRVYFSK
jgi:hypothetical protein